VVSLFFLLISIVTNASRRPAARIDIRMRVATSSSIRSRIDLPYVAIPYSRVLDARCDVTSLPRCASRRDSTDRNAEGQVDSRSESRSWSRSRIRTIDPSCGPTRSVCTTTDQAGRKELTTKTQMHQEKKLSDLVFRALVVKCLSLAAGGCCKPANPGGRHPPFAQVSRPRLLAATSSRPSAPLRFQSKRLAAREQVTVSRLVVLGLITGHRWASRCP